MNTEVLLVNGTPSQRRANRDVLERAGYQVREVLATDRALRMARTKPPLAVVVASPEGHDLPRDFIHRLRRHPATQEVPVLVIAPDVPRDEIEQCECQSCIGQPHSPRWLLEELAYLTRPHGRVGPGTPVDEGHAILPSPACP